MFTILKSRHTAGFPHLDSLVFGTVHFLASVSEELSIIWHCLSSWRAFPLPYIMASTFKPQMAWQILLLCQIFDFRTFERPHPVRSRHQDNSILLYRITGAHLRMLPTMCEHYWGNNIFSNIVRNEGKQGHYFPKVTKEVQSHGILTEKTTLKQKNHDLELGRQLHRLLCSLCKA